MPPERAFGAAANHGRRLNAHPQVTQNQETVPQRVCHTLHDRPAEVALGVEGGNAGKASAQVVIQIGGYLPLKIRMKPELIGTSGYTFRHGVHQPVSVVAVYGSLGGLAAAQHVPIPAVRSGAGFRGGAGVP
ncbi:hypothetical protein SDC9_149259 [bioreactor metagenome]|uniref:Uncharacterized protein n=1 Tax=bioreactor metagenome TaxID=1076179 RepID=A0A645EKQ9_9ZZZZ